MAILNFKVYVLALLFCLLLPYKIFKMGKKKPTHLWTNITSYASHFIFFISILNSILVSNEYSFKTNRQNVIDGLTRSDFYHAKWLSVVTLSITTTVITFVIALLFGLVRDGCISCAFEGLTPLLYLLVACINYYGMALLLALLFKRSGLAIGMFLLYVAVIEPMLSLYFTQYLGNEYLNLFLPLQSSDELFHFDKTVSQDCPRCEKNQSN